MKQHDRELELKYAVIDPAAARAAIGDDTLAGLDAGPWRTIDVVDQYIDTASGALARAGYGVRLRRSGRRTTLTLKGASRGATRGTHAAKRPERAGLHDRMELEGRATRRLDPRRWPESAARAVVEAATGGEQLRTLFYLDQRREERDLARDGVVLAKLTFDTARVRRFARVLDEFVTLEIESVMPISPESAAALESIAVALEPNTALRPEARSKEEIARAIVERSGSAWRRAAAPRNPGIKPEDTLAEAGRKVLRMHLLRMLAAERGIRAGHDVVAVHKMRVATRRMRAAWRVFGSAFQPRVRRRYVDELRVVAADLGAVRDLDVQLERLATYQTDLDEDGRAALTPLREEWQRRRGEASDELLELLSSAPYDRFVGDYHAFVSTPGAGSTAASRLTGDASGGLIWTAYERLLAHDATIDWLDTTALHAVRIDAKRTRYTLEFVREILPATSERLIAGLVAAQDALGLLNDAQIAADMTRTWLVESASALSEAERQAAGAYIEAALSDVARVRRTFRPLWRRVAGRTYRRAVALTITDIGAI